MSAMRPIITVGQPHIAGTIDLFRVECLALRAQKKGSTHASEPVPPWPLGNGAFMPCAGRLFRINKDRGLQLVRQEDQFGIRTVIQFVPKIG